ncbi:MAG: 6-bladed beta-propeller [Bacteroidota bacterium]
MNNLFPILFLVVCLSCSNDKQVASKGQLDHISVKEAFDRKEKVMLSEVADAIEYIPLETNENCLVGNNTIVDINNDYLIVVSFRQIFLFDRKSGDFIREIGGYGKGPEEYMATIHQPYRKERKIITARQSGAILEYNLDGSVNRTVKSPYELLSSLHTELSTDTYASYMPNVMGDTPELLLLFDAGGNKLKVIPNTNFYEKEGKFFSFHGREAEFYKYDGTNYFKEIWNDTLFSVANDTLLPHYVFNSGALAINFAIRGQKDAFTMMKDLLRIHNIFESSDHLFFSITYQQREFAGFHNKKKSETRVCNFDEVGNNGFVDDIMGISHLVPHGISAENELYGLITPDSLQLAELKKGEPYSNGRQISPESNPVVVIAKLK